jgi:hypothetical protein
MLTLYITDTFTVTGIALTLTTPRGDLRPRFGQNEDRCSRGNLFHPFYRPRRPLGRVEV